MSKPVLSSVEGTRVEGSARVRRGLRQAQSLLRANGGDTPFGLRYRSPRDKPFDTSGRAVLPPPFGLSLSKPSSNTCRPFDTGPFDGAQDRLRQAQSVLTTNGGDTPFGLRYRSPGDKPFDTSGRAVLPPPFGLSLSKPSSNTCRPFDTGLRQAQSLLRANGGDTPFGLRYRSPRDKPFDTSGRAVLAPPLGLSLSKPSSNTCRPLDTGPFDGTQDRLRQAQSLLRANGGDTPFALSRD